MKKLLLIGAFVFASLAGAPQVFADVVYEQPFDNASTSTLEGAYRPIATWVNPSTTDYGSATQILFFVESAPCLFGACGSVQFLISTTSNTGSAFLAADSFSIPQSGFPDADGYLHHFNTANGTTTVSAGQTLWLLASYSFGGGATITYEADSSLNLKGIITTDSTDPEFTGTTRIIAFDPEDGEVIASTTSGTIEISGFVSDDDFQTDGTFVTMRLWNTAYILSQAAGPLIPFAALGGTGGSPVNRMFTFAVDAPGPFVYSTTTDLSVIGQYNLQGRIQNANPSSFFNFIRGLFGSASSVLDQEQILFTVATSSTMDAFRPDSPQSVSVITDAINQATQNCVSILSTPLECIAFYIIPSQGDIETTLQSIYDNLVTRPPFGYINRFWQILAGETVTMPPPLTYTFGSSSPAVLQGNTVSYQIWDYVGSTSPLYMARADDGSNKNIWDIVMPYWQVIVAFAVFAEILWLTLGFAIQTMQDLGDERVAMLESENRRKWQTDRLYAQTITNHEFGRKYGSVSYDRNLDS